MLCPLGKRWIGAADGGRRGGGGRVLGRGGWRAPRRAGCGRLRLAGRGGRTGWSAGSGRVQPGAAQPLQPGPAAGGGGSSRRGHPAAVPRCPRHRGSGPHDDARGDHVHRPRSDPPAHRPGPCPGGRAGRHPRSRGAGRRPAGGLRLCGPEPGPGYVRVPAARAARPDRPVRRGLPVQRPQPGPRAQRRS